MIFIFSIKRFFENSVFTQELANSK